MEKHTSSTPLSAHVEALLFAEGGSLSLKKIAQLLNVSLKEASDALPELRANLAGRGLSLITTETEASLVISPETRDAVKSAYERELGREIGDAGLEVLSILLYRGPSTRAQIDYIRGVNTSSTIRTLLSRGLVERIGNPEDAREYLYRPTVELLAHLGVTRREDLPEYATIAAELAAFEQSQKQEEPLISHEGPGTTDAE